jgi:phage terminase large subunit-like protein
LSDALSAKLLAAKLRFSAAGILGCFVGMVVVGLDVSGVSAKVIIDTAPVGSEPPVWSRQHVHEVVAPPLQ